MRQAAGMDMIFRRRLFLMKVRRNTLLGQAVRRSCGQGEGSMRRENAKGIERGERDSRFESEFFVQT